LAGLFLTMAGTPTIRYTGQGSRSQAAQLGHMVADGVAGALATPSEPLQIDTLRVQVPAGASRRDIECAIRLAIARKAAGRP